MKLIKNALVFLLSAWYVNCFWIFNIVDKNKNQGLAAFCVVSIITISILVLIKSIFYIVENWNEED